MDKELIRFKGLENYASKNFENEIELSTAVSLDKFEDPWEEKWEDTKKRLKSLSPFKHFNSWDAKAVIVKGHDDLRQELLAMQIIKKSENMPKNLPVSFKGQC